MMEEKQKEPKFQIGDIVSHCFKNGNIETKEISKVLFISHDRNATKDAIYYGIFAHRPNTGCGMQLVSEDDLTLVRKWNAAVPTEPVKQLKVKSQPTYSFMKVTDKSFETLELAAKLIEGLTSADIMEYDQDNRIIEVNKNLVDKLCEFVNSNNRLFDLGYDQYVMFNESGFWINNERFGPQQFLDEVVEPIIVKELKRRVLSNKSWFTEKYLAN